MPCTFNFLVTDIVRRGADETWPHIGGDIFEIRAPVVYIRMLPRAGFGQYDISELRTTNDKLNFTTSTRHNSRQFKKHLVDVHLNIHSYVYELSGIYYAGVAFATADNLHFGISDNFTFRLWLLDDKGLENIGSR